MKIKEGGKIMWGKIAALVAIIGSVLGAYIYLDNRFAHAEDMRSQANILESVQANIAILHRKMSYNQLQAMVDYRQRKIWRIEDKFGKDLKHASQGIKDDYHEIVLEIQKLEKRMLEIEKKNEDEITKKKGKTN